VECEEFEGKGNFF